MVGDPLVPLCPLESVTSVVAIHYLMANWPERAGVDPVGEFV
jgi:phage terminase large subunit-like protein